MATFGAIDGHPTYEFGDGDRSLVVIPGLSDAFQAPRESTLSGLALERYYYRPYTDDYTVRVVSRPRDLPDGTTTRDLADGYAAVLETLDSPVHVEGLSMGGLIGQYLAADHPALVDRFVCAVSGVRLSDRGREIVSRWEGMADDGDLLGIYLDSIPVTYGDGLRSSFYRVLLSAVGERLLPPPANPHDVVVQAAACLAHDASDVLGAIEAPTLLVGGEHDPLFPPSILEETAAGIPDSRLEVFSDTAHGAFEQRKGTFDRLVRAFLDADRDATL